MNQLVIDYGKPGSALLRRVGIAVLLGVLTGQWAFADDVEIFTSTDDQAMSCEAPNVLFIIDTSGSMGVDVLTQQDWDPAQTYDGCFDADRIYFTLTGTPPDCDAEESFPKSKNFCLNASGSEYTGLLQSWDPDLEVWGRLSAADDDRPVECAADEGIHGDGMSGAAYAVDGADGPWSSNFSDRIAWGTNATPATLFDGNWLNWQRNPPTERKSRLNVVKDVVTNTLDSMANVNVGLMKFNSADGGPVIAAVSDLTESRTVLKQRIRDLEPDRATPLSETLYEAGQYLAGRLVDFGDKDNNRSVAESRIGNSPTGDRYRSPLDSSGQNNYIVLLTDGVPTDDKDANQKIEALPGFAELVGGSCSNAVDGACLDKMAQYLYLADLRDDVPGQQNVITHTIGFTIDFELLENTAASGGGKYFVADDTAALTRALANLAKDFTRNSSLLTAPTIPINSFNRADRLNEVYLSLFEPGSSYHWPGNLKKYRLIRTDNRTVLVDAGGRSALAPDGNFINDEAVSLWSAPLVDGANIQLGGAASRLLRPDTRNLLTNASGDTTLSQLGTGNPDITAGALGAPDDERDLVINWARGMDTRDADGDGDNTDPRLSMGDPLHVQPVVGEYGNDELSRNGVVFIATNDGYLHAIDASLGTEIWAFIPQRLLGRLYGLSLDEAAQNKQYGLDGRLVLINDADGKPETLLFGMRRGGHALFAMDVSNRTAPRLRWLINATQPDFLDLGQTWSPPVVAKVDIGGRVHRAAIFAGGYDPGQDNRTFRTDTKGNAVYFVDLETGDLLWSAGSALTARSNHDLPLPRMQFSIPAGIRVLDRNADGLADRMYVGDMGGQLWRFDIVNGNTAAGLVEGGVLASLGAAEAASTSADVRRFYNTPDVVRVIKGENAFTAINIGSGYRAHPLDAQVSDEFYSVRDFNPARAIPTSEYDSPALPLITRDNLIDITTNTTPSLEPSDAGWRLGMVQDPGEKILGESLTLDNVLFFNSFAPSSAVQSCLPGAGINRNYRISVIDGSPLTNLDRSADAENLTPTDRFVEGQLGAPVSDPGFGPDDKVCSGLDCFDGDDEFETDDANDGPDDGPIVRKTYWYPVEAP